MVAEDLSEVLHPCNPGESPGNKERGTPGQPLSKSWHSGSLPLLKPFSLTKVIWGWHLGEGWEIGLLQAPTPSEGIRHSLLLVAQGRRLRGRL